jgi:hypothetical protein
MESSEENGSVGWQTRKSVRFDLRDAVSRASLVLQNQEKGAWERVTGFIGREIVACSRNPEDTGIRLPSLGSLSSSTQGE